MWRSAGLVAGLAAMAVLLVACGDGGGPSVKACFIDPTHPPTITTNSLPRVSLEEARRRFDWIKVPSELPAGVTAGTVLVYAPYCPEVALDVTIPFQGPGYQFTIEEFPGGIGGVTGQPTPIRINGVDGKAVPRQPWRSRDLAEAGYNVRRCRNL